MEDTLIQHNSIPYPYVVHVDESDRVLGIEEKIKAHREALLHRAFSVFLFNENGEMLLQRRALSKYHSPGLWTNAVCSHPYIHESYQEAAKRRLNEELGIQVDLKPSFHFIYKADVGEGLWEHELDHVFTGIYAGDCKANPEEVMAVRYINIKDLTTEITNQPESFTVWFKIILDNYINLL